MQFAILACVICAAVLVFAAIRLFDSTAEETDQPRLSDPPRLPEVKPELTFTLSNLNGELIKNTSWEYNEQQNLARVVRAGDNVLNLGGNIGTSCIYAAKLGANVACVEPVESLSNLIEQNAKDNNVSMKVVNAALTTTTDPLWITCGRRRHAKNLVGATISKEPCDPSESFCQKVNVQNKLPFERTSVLFADCEGCLPSFIKEFGSHLDDVEVVVYEKDQGMRGEGEHVDYTPVEEFLRDHKFVCETDKKEFQHVCARAHRCQSR